MKIRCFKGKIFRGIGKTQGNYLLFQTYNISNNLLIKYLHCTVIDTDFYIG